MPPVWSRVVELATAAIGVSEPNPRVGCVITAPTGEVLGEGHTQAVGGPHAEVMALRDAVGRGHSLRGATAWVNLEPCAHHGRTPPCCDALIDAGIARVHTALRDPFPAVAGQGIARMRAAGVAVFEDAPAEIREAALRLNIGFFSRILRGRPWLRMKAAMSMDGRTALTNGASQWITSAAARRDGHAFRARAGAVLTGVGTVREDDPRLDVREVDTQVQPVRVVVDSRLEIAPTARILQAPGRVWLACAEDRLASPQARALQDTGCELMGLPAPGGKTDLHALAAELSRRQINELHVEAGHRLNASWVKAGLVDEWLIYAAPRLIGEGAGLASLGELQALSESVDYQWMASAIVGSDLRLQAVLPQAWAELHHGLGLMAAAGPS